MQPTYKSKSLGSASGKKIQFCDCGYINLRQLPPGTKRKLEQIRKINKHAADFDLESAKPLNKCNIRKNEKIIANGRYALISKVGKNSVQIKITRDYSISILKIHLPQVAKEIPDMIPVRRVLGRPASSIDKQLAIPMSDPSTHEYVLVNSKEGDTYQYSRVRKKTISYTLLEGQNDKKIKKSLLSILALKIPPLSDLPSIQLPQVSPEKKHLMPAFSQARFDQAKSKGGYGLVRYNRKCYQCFTDPKTGYLILETPLGKLSVDPFHVDPPSNIYSNEFIDDLNEAFEETPNVTARDASTSRLKTSEKYLFLRLNKKMQQMGIDDQALIKNMHALLKRCYSKFTKSSCTTNFIAKLAVNVIGDHRFSKARLDQTELEGICSTDAIFFFWHIYQAFERRAKKNKVDDPKLYPFLNKLINLQEKLLISSLMTESARNADDKDREKIINYIVSIFEKDIKRVYSGDRIEAGAWTGGFPGHFVIIRYQRSHSNLLFSLQQVGLGAAYHKQLEGKRIINEFRLGNYLLKKRINDNGKTIITHGYVFNKNYIDNKLTDLLQKIVRLKVYGTENEYIDWLENIYQKQKEFVHNSAFLRTGVSQNHQVIGNCAIESHKSLYKKLEQDAELQTWPGMKQFMEKNVLLMLQEDVFTENRIYLGKISDEKEKSLEEIAQICWEKHMSLSQFGKKRVKDKKFPRNLTLSLPLNPSITVDLERLMDGATSLLVTEESSAPKTNTKQTKILVFKKSLASEKIATAWLLLDKKEVNLSNWSDKIPIKAGKKMLHHRQSIKVKPPLQINLAPHTPEGFYLELN